MGQAPNKLSFFFLCLLFGGGVAAVGIKELKPHFDQEHIRASRAHTELPALEESQNIAQILHGDADIERAAMDPAFASKFKDHRDKLSSADKSAMKKLIEKVTE